MQLFADISLAACGVSLLFLLIGLFKPWYMLWWEDRQNRKKVIKVYGFAALLFFVIYEVLTKIYSL
ncbi:hypothetical protein [Fulvivirga lutea]|uniref:Uncharacterized protein n=1 Tax=Fulvivirga lutea TaxID=2810512 RepID=A0A974WI23_9BACT|nr:hypothetical protein [Fulvivirga lutea]QSE98284.1 hypothetical protein JR347_04175 [Fulvivirga lutea]